MNHMQKFGRQISMVIFFGVWLTSALTILLWWLTDKHLGLATGWSIVVAVGLSLCLAVIAAYVLASIINRPVSLLWQAVLHVSPGLSTTPAPDPQKARIGRELVSSLILQVYQLAGIAKDNNSYLTKAAPVLDEVIARYLPLPVLAVSTDSTVRFANEAAVKYCAAESTTLVGKNIYDVLDLSFPSQNTYESWLKNCRQNKVTASQTWERVRLRTAGEQTYRQLDIAASYSKDDPSGIESVIALFDHSDRYGNDDQALNFIALAVHELRTPLTVLRGYIEVFEEEVSNKLNDPELKDFMYKMRASSEALASFVNNILNVARIEENQLVLKLDEENWEEVLKTAVNVMSLQAQVHNKTIELNLAPNLPTVAVDRVSISEVLYNLIDNAIKYSGDGPKKITVQTAMNQEGLVETTVADFGVGIPEGIVPNLFEKFYRNHRTRTQVGGTGLGLYLSKSIVSAHGGNIWVRSKEGEGSRFSFTLVPYSNLADELKNNDNKEITRSAYGWIKNHSLYRR